MRVSPKPGKAADQQEVAALFQILGNKTRMRIVQEIAAGEQCVCTIFKELGLPQNLISHHLGILREHGVLHARREGKWVYYSLNRKILAHLGKAIKGILEAPERKRAC
ncbi:MAG: metalloregulator ArsR/SmtB family transcription factor [Candidatus Peribacteraceae bacterium]|nr:metalloregulator ArsR/SmtB family transcription factor [Candidatus Peribacteraceae bacterium]